MEEQRGSDNLSKSSSAGGIRHLKLVPVDEGARSGARARDGAAVRALQLTTLDSLHYLTDMICELRVLAQKAGHANLAIILDLASREAEVQRARVELNR